MRERGRLDADCDPFDTVRGRLGRKDGGAKRFRVHLTDLGAKWCPFKVVFATESRFGTREAGAITLSGRRPTSGG